MLLMIKLLARRKYTIMSSFTQILNPITGKNEWNVECEDYDYHQEVARAAFADMLHDSDRNKKYFSALKIAIEKTQKLGKPANVLDIGTGTGILSMMAVKCGADSVVACEAFSPMAATAEKIIELNGMKDKIHLIKKRSTEIKVGENCDMLQKANILVTEVFDTELIGEGAIGIFNHAHEFLLQKDCIVIPDRGTIYAQAVECPLAYAWNRPKSIANLDGEILIKTPERIINCPGSLSLHDVQLSQIPLNDFKTIIKPQAVLEFDWSGKTTLQKERVTKFKVNSERDGMIHVIFMWWDLKMDEAGEIILSCAPFWDHPDFPKLQKENKSNWLPEQNLIPWRDHWMQALYYLPKDVQVTKDQKLNLISNHDEYALWFNVVKEVEECSNNECPMCECGLHISYSRSRIQEMNNSLRNKKYIKVLEENINENSVILILSDGSILGLAASVLGAKKLYCLEQNRISRKVLESYIEFNNLKNVTVIGSVDEIGDLSEITCVIGEPFFIASIVPWDNFYFGTVLTSIKDKLRDDVFILPKTAKIYALPVEFLDLHKIRSPLGICEGFDLKIFDNLIEKASNLTDTIVEAQPLWEYPCRPLGSAKEMLSIDFENYSQNLESSGEIKMENSGNCNGIVVWVDWNLDGKKTIVGTGPVNNNEIEKFVVFEKGTRQGVHLLPRSKSVNENSILKWDNRFIPKSGEIKFNFRFK